MPTDSHQLTSVPPAASTRSRITNGSEMLPGVDGRGVWARRFRDMNDAFLNHLGGEDNVSEPQRSLCRRAAAIETELNHIEAAFAASRAAGAVPTQEQLDLYSRLSGAQRRLIDAIGLKRKAREIPPTSLAEYMKAFDAELPRD